MAPGIDGIEGSPHGHDVVPVKGAVAYLQKRGYPESVTSIYQGIKAAASPYTYLGSTKDVGANRVVFGEAVNLVLDKLGKLPERLLFANRRTEMVLAPVAAALQLPLERSRKLPGVQQFHRSLDRFLASGPGGPR